MPSMSVSVLHAYACVCMLLALGSVCVAAGGGKQHLPAFKRMVAFGDDFTDNSQGSYAHGITGDPARLWGFGTWTDGLVTASVLANNMGMRMAYDYAWGSANGGSQIGSICDNTAIPAGHGSGHAHWNLTLVPDMVSQIANYTSVTSPYKADIQDTLHFYWTGNNDVIASLGWTGRFTICDQDKLCWPGEAAFAKQMGTYFSNTLTSLAKAGAKYAVVMNIYPRHLSPWTAIYIANSTGMIANFGSVIEQTNAQLATAVQQVNSKYGTKFMLFDAFSWLQSAIADPAISGVTTLGNGFPYTCVDGCDSSFAWNTHWQNTVIAKKPSDFFWMTTVMPSATVLKSLAAAVQKFLNQQRV